jgi:hypothetical protein
MRFTTFRLVIALAWVAVGIAVLLAESLTYGLYAWQASVIVLSALSLALGLVGFYAGGGQISAMNIWSFSFALFVGFAGIYIITNYQAGIRVPYLLTAVAIAYFGQVVTVYCFWVNPMKTSTERTLPVATSEVSRLGIFRGAALFTAAFLLSLRYSGNILANSATFAGGVLLSTSMFLRPAKTVGTTVRVIICLVMLVLNARYVFNGFGRLQLGAFGLAIAIAASTRFKGRTVKIAILVVSIPVMLYFAHHRVAYTASLNSAQSPNVTGFESVVSPLYFFSSLLEMHFDGQLALHYFSTMRATLTLWIPHRVWSGKPPGFGALLGNLFFPQLQGTGFSTYALFQGEWLYSFGLAGLVAMVPFVGLSIRWLQNRLTPMFTRNVNAKRELLRLTVAIVFIAGLPDLLWGGTFNYLSRALFRAVILAVVVSFPALKRFHISPETRRLALDREGSHEGTPVPSMDRSEPQLPSSDD